MGLPSSVSFRASQIDPTAIIPAAPRPDASEDTNRFERHLDESRSRDDRKVDRRDERRHRDRTESARDAKKPEKDAAAQKDADSTAETAPTPLAAVVEAPIVPTIDTKTVKTEAVAKTDDADTAPVPETESLLAASKSAETKPEDAEEATPELKPEIAGVAVSKTDEKNPKNENKADAAGTLMVVPAAAHAVSHKPDIQAPKAEVKTDAASLGGPVSAAQAPLIAATNADADADAPQAPTEATDPDGGLAIKSKEGLGHEAAASMAEKSDAKSTGAQQPAPNAQPQATHANAATPANFAKTLAAATGGEVTSVSATNGDGSGAARLTDLQNVGSNSQNQNTNTATVRIGTLPGQTTPTQVPAMAIALQVARNLQKGVNRFDIRLDPAEMGRIDVRMEVKKDGNVAAHLVVDRPETLDLLQRDSRALQQALNDAGLQANSDSLNFSLRDQNAGGGDPSFGSSAASTSSTGQTAQATEETTLGPIYNINLSATGGIDIRV
jgi:flagellar hook-length control protein FliK